MVGTFRNLLVAVLLLVPTGTLMAIDPTLTLKTTPLDSTLEVGESTTIIVSAQISDSASDDGLIDYDLDIFPLDKTGVHFSGLAILDPNATIISTGTFDPTTGGILGIRGHYTTTDKGIAAPVNLFSILLFADKVGLNSISTGLSVYPAGTGIPFTLNKSGIYEDPSFGDPVSFTVNSSLAVAPITVLPAVPEPATGLLGLVTLSSLLIRRRR
jgi:hypothetical protein